MSLPYNFAYADIALQYLETAVPGKIRGQIKRKIDSIAYDPHPPGTKKLAGVMAGDDPVYRLRSGDYRILYIVRSQTKQIVILDIDNRKDVYRQ